MSNVSLVNGHIDRPKMMDEEIIKVRVVSLEEQIQQHNERKKKVFDSYYCRNTGGGEDPLEICVLRESAVLISKLESIINRQKAEIEELQKENEDFKCVRFFTARGSNKSVISNFINYNTGLEDGAKELAERVNPIIEELVDIMFDDNHSKCMIKNCHKHSSIPCESAVQSHLHLEIVKDGDRVDPETVLYK